MPRRTHSAAGTARPEPERYQYKRIVISFLVAVVAIVSLVLYYSLAQATITLETGTSQAVRETTVGVTGSGEGGAVAGAITQTEVEQTKTFTASASGEKEDKASGVVTITNTTGAGQTLIATTRLLSPQNALFRLKETVNVPARGKVANIPVVADKPGDGSEIGPTKFTFPGLRPNLQDKIYAESSEPMRRAEKPGNKVTSLDFEQARKALADLLIPQALAKLREQLPPAKRAWSVVYQSDTAQGSPSVPAGTAQPNFAYTLKAKVTAVFYDPATLHAALLATLQGDTSTGHKIVSLEDQSIATSLDSVSQDLTTASLKVKLLTQETITDPDLAFSKAALVGRTPAEVKNYFSNVPGVVNATVVLSPFWVKTVPTIESHITIVLKQ